MRLTISSAFFLVLISCNANNGHSKAVSKQIAIPEQRPGQISYYKCDYSKQQYDTILSTWDEHTTTEVWGVNKSDLSTLPNISSQTIDTVVIVKKARMHLKKKFGDMIIFSSELKLERINNEDSSNPRNWFIGVSFLYDKRGYYQKVPLLLDGRLILSSNE